MRGLGLGSTSQLVMSGLWPAAGTTPVVPTPPPEPPPHIVAVSPGGVMSILGLRRFPRRKHRVKFRLVLEMILRRHNRREIGPRYWTLVVYVGMPSMGTPVEQAASYGIKLDLVRTDHKRVVSRRVSRLGLRLDASHTCRCELRLIDDAAPPDDTIVLLAAMLGIK